MTVLTFVVVLKTSNEKEECDNNDPVIDDESDSSNEESLHRLTHKELRQKRILQKLWMLTTTTSSMISGKLKIRIHLAFKTSWTTRTYNLTVNHKRRILNSTTGHPGRWNDETLFRFDACVSQLQRGEFNDKMTFELKTKQRSSIIVKGAYVIVDNGYMEWFTTVPPLKDSIHKSEIRFSQWLESLRKDVECTFGILKWRWRILKTVIRLHDTEAADNVWLTCCALRNMLLDVDGLSKRWAGEWRSILLLGD